MKQRVVVCDASCWLLAWLFDEPEAGSVRAALRRWEASDIEVVVPSLLWLEVGNALVGRRGLSDDQVLEGLLRLEGPGIRTIEPDRPTRLLALQLARRTGLTVYDALYLALARTLDADLATFDTLLRAASSGREHAVGEGPAAYGPRLDPVSVAAIGTHLAELRADLGTR